MSRHYEQWKIACKTRWWLLRKALTCIPAYICRTLRILRTFVLRATLLPIAHSAMLATQNRVALYHADRSGTENTEQWTPTNYTRHAVSHASYNSLRAVKSAITQLNHQIISQTDGENARLKNDGLKYGEQYRPTADTYETTWNHISSLILVCCHV